MGPPDGPEAGQGPVFGVVVALIFAGLGNGGAVVDEDADVDAHDGQDGAHVQVHHEDALQQKEQPSLSLDAAMRNASHYETLSVLDCSADRLERFEPPTNSAHQAKRDTF